MEEIENKKENKPRFDRSDLLSILAVIVSLSALGVSVYETSILSKQSELMREQQKASVWPYLEMNGDYYFGEKTKVNFSFENKGVGPAKIESFEILINGEKLSGYDEINSYIKKLIPNADQTNVSLRTINGVLAANESVQVFDLESDGSKEVYQIIRDLNFQYKICYCSIYDDCWFLDSDADGLTKGCKK